MRDGDDVLVNHAVGTLFVAVCTWCVLGGGEDGGESNLVLFGEEFEGFVLDDFADEDVDVEGAVVCESVERGELLVL